VKILVEDLNAFAAVRHLDLAAYLRSRGWREVEGDQGSSTWEAADGAADVLLPKHPKWRDYAKRVRDVVRTLGELESRSEELILRDVAHVSADIVRLRAAAPAMRDGTIPLVSVLELSDAGRGILLAAACAAAEPRRAYHTRKTARAVEFVSSLKLGQSERGSYVLTILSAVPPSLDFQQPLPMPDIPDPGGSEPFARRVTKVLAESMSLVLDAAEKGIVTGSLAAFEDAIPKGVSADLCEAVASLPRSVDSIGISVTWAPTRPSTVAATATEFTPDVLEVIAEAGRQLRERAPIEDFQLVGPVLKIDRHGEEKRGLVQILGAVEGQPRKVAVELAADAWELAHTAIDTRVFLSCVGDLVKLGKSFTLANPRRVEIFAPEN